MIQFKPPVIQIALDFATSEEALAMAKIGIEAGFDWLEVGTPLIVSEGLSPIGRLARAFPAYPVLADYKTMDSGGKNVERTLQHGGQIMTVCAGAPDETIKSAVAASKKTGIWVIVDTIGVKSPAARARQCAEWGVNMVYLHYGADQNRDDPSRDATQWIDEVLACVDIPVGIGCFGIDDAVKAVRKGVEYIVTGHPLVSGKNPLQDLKEFVKAVRANYSPRKRGG